MAKQKEIYYDAQGNPVHVKKKRNPFLLGCGGLLLLMLLIGACSALFLPSSEETGTKETTTTEKTSEEKSDDNKKLKIGEEVTKKDVKFKPTKAYFTDERNEFADTKADKVLVIDMDITNNGKEDIPVGTDVTAYADGKKLETYPVDGNLFESLSPGRSISGKQGFAVVGNPKKFELEFEPFLSGEKAIYEIELK